MTSTRKRKPHIGDIIDSPALQLLPLAAATVSRSKYWPRPQLLPPDAEGAAMEPALRRPPVRVH